MKNILEFKVNDLPFIVNRKKKTVSLILGRKYLREQDILTKKLEIVYGMREIVKEVFA